MNAPVHIYPFPREATFGQGVFGLGPTVSVGLEGEVTERLPAVTRLREGLEEKAGVTVTVSAGREADIVLAMPACDPLPDEGYRLEVTDSAGQLTAADTRGLFWGVVSLLKLLRVEDGEALLREATVVDWPRLPIRGVHVYIPAREDIPFFKRFIRHLLSDHKLNTIFLEVGAGMRFKKHPELNQGAVEFTQDILARGQRPAGPQGRFQDSTHHEIAGGAFLEQEEVRDLVGYARAHEVEVIPEIPSLSHTYYLLTGHRELAELPEAEWPDAYCPSNPATYDLLFEVMDEYLEVIQPRRVHIGHDEWRAAGLCEKCKGRTAELFAEDVARIHKYLTDRGLGVMMWGDHYVKEHDGTAKSTRGGDIWYDFPQTYEAVECAPKDILLLNWSWSRGEGPEDDLAGHGFKQIYGNFSPARFSPEEWERRSSKPYILGGEVSTWTAANEFCLGKDGILHTMLHAANRLWSPHLMEAPEHHRLLRDLFVPLREHLRGTASVAAHAEPGDFLFIDLSARANAPLPGGLAGVSRQADDRFAVPFAFTECCLQLRREGEPVARDEAALRRARSVTRADAALPGVEEEQAKPDLEAPPADAPTAVRDIRVAGRFRSLVFLHSAAGHGRHERSFSAIGRVADSSEHIGSYVIRYQDGQSAEVEIRYGQNVARPDLGFGSDRESICYFAVPIFCGESEGAPTLYALEWVNPRPEVAVRSVDFVATRAETAAAPILLALTAVK